MIFTEESGFNYSFLHICQGFNKKKIFRYFIVFFFCDKRMFSLFSHNNYYDIVIE